MLQASDTNIRAYIRSVLTQRRMELSCLDIGSFRGTVRLRGELRRIGGSADITAEVLENMEHEILRLRGVRRVHLHFSNWKKLDDTGEWVALVHNSPAVMVCEEESVDEDAALAN